MTRIIASIKILMITQFKICDKVKGSSVEVIYVKLIIICIEHDVDVQNQLAFC